LFSDSPEIISRLELVGPDDIELMQQAAHVPPETYVAAPNTPQVHINVLVTGTDETHQNLAAEAYGQYADELNSRANMGTHTRSPETYRQTARDYLAAGGALVHIVAHNPGSNGLGAFYRRLNELREQ
jgi:hypothetical protein